MKIALEMLKKLHACQPGIDAFVEKFGQEADLREAVEWSIASGEETTDYALWLLPRLMTRTQQVSYAVHAARLVLPVFENKHPDDPRPRQAIEAAENWLKNPPDDAAACAARSVAAAYHAAYHAVAAADDAANAADAAYHAVAAAYHAAAADTGNVKRDCLTFGLGLLGA